MGDQLLARVNPGTPGKSGSRTADPAPGRATRVQATMMTLEGAILQQLRGALGALDQLRTTWTPMLEAAVEANRAPDDLLVLDVRSALRRVVTATAQATRLQDQLRSPEVDRLLRIAHVQAADLRPRIAALLDTQDDRHRRLAA